ncbi:heavy metal-binding domain-containing protein [Paracoccus litorisediminis]|uniref:YbjQ family protein n=1 Tax=Paracoccus litorisediminis TaxID=2006130 RepID=UPI0037321CA0
MKHCITCGRSLSFFRDKTKDQCDWCIEQDAKNAAQEQKAAEWRAGAAEREERRLKMEQTREADRLREEKATRDERARRDTQRELRRQQHLRNAPDITLTSETSVPGVKHRLGFISADCTEGGGMMRDLKAGLTDSFGGRSEAFETSIQAVRRKVLKELTKQADSMGANAIIGLRVHVSNMGDVGKMVLASATGTAVYIEQDAASDRSSGE